MTETRRPGRREREFRALVETMIQSFRAGDAALLVECWAMPSLAIDDAGVSALTSLRAVRAHCDALIASMQARGPGSATARIERVEPLADNMLLAEVTWMPPGGDVASDLRHFYLARGDADQLRLCLSVTLPAAPGATDELTRALQETFPASDPVAITGPTTSLGPPKGTSGRRQAHEGATDGD